MTRVGKKILRDGTPATTHRGISKNAGTPGFQVAVKQNKAIAKL